MGLNRERTECSASGEWLVSCPKAEPSIAEVAVALLAALGFAEVVKWCISLSTAQAQSSPSSGS